MRVAGAVHVNFVWCSIAYLELHAMELLLTFHRFKIPAVLHYSDFDEYKITNQWYYGTCLGGNLVLLNEAREVVEAG